MKESTYFLQKSGNLCNMTCKELQLSPNLGLPRRIAQMFAIKE